MGKWEESTIGDQFTIKTGGTPSKSKPEYYKNGNIPWLVSGDINRIEINECDNYINELGLKSSNARILPKHIVMMALNGQGKTKGSVAILNIEAACNQSLVGIIPKDRESQSPKFLFYYLQSQYLNIRKLAGGDDRRGLNMGLIRSIKFNFPKSLPEQQRIVAKLDGLFEKIDRAITLVEENIAHTQALMGSVLDEEFGRLDCEMKKLSEVTTIVGGGTPKTKIAEYWGEDVVWLSPTDLPPIGVISRVNNSRKKISELGLSKSSAKLLPAGSVVFSTRASIGKIALADVELSTNQGFTNFIVNESLDNLYLCWVLKKSTPEIETLSNSTTFKEVSKTAIKNFEIPVPKLRVQKDVSEKLHFMQMKVDKAIENQTQQLASLKYLKSSLLDKAFRGEL